MTLEQTGEREVSEDALVTYLAHRRSLLENAVTAIIPKFPMLSVQVYLQHCVSPDDKV